MSSNPQLAKIVRVRHFTEVSFTIYTTLGGLLLCFTLVSDAMKHFIFKSILTKMQVVLSGLPNKSKIKFCSVMNILNVTPILTGKLKLL